MRQRLEQEYIKIESMKEEINKQAWRKVAGEILSTDLENRVEAMLEESSKVLVGKTTVRDMTGSALVGLENELRKAVRLRS